MKWHNKPKTGRCVENSVSPAPLFVVPVNYTTFYCRWQQTARQLD